MAAVILTALAVAWLWHAIDLFRVVDPETLPPRARRRFAGEDEQPLRAGTVRPVAADVTLAACPVLQLAERSR
jgi:hypothetical protein